MLRRLFSRPLLLHLQTLASLHSPYPLSPPLLLPPRIPLSNFDSNSSHLTLHAPRLFSSSNRNGGGGDGDGDGTWKISPDSDEADSLFSAITEATDESFSPEPSDEVKRPDAADSWSTGDGDRDLFGSIEKELATKEGAGSLNGDEWETADGDKAWTLGEDEQRTDLFGSVEGGEVGIEGLDGDEFESAEKQRVEEEKLELEMKEKELLEKLKGPNRAFGDLIAASGITEDMIDSLILLKDVSNVPGLPPLREIEEKAIAKLNATSGRAEIEKKKQEEIARARVRTVDEKGRAYATGRRKCSVARIWIEKGDGKFVVNDKLFDVYFPILDHRAELLRPFTVTKTLGEFDVKCTVKGGGVSGQVGAIRLGISRALQNFDPGHRPFLKEVGYLTRDARVVERKKPGKAKARKSFQWVKR